MPEARVDVSTITDAEWDVSMRIFQRAIKRFFELPGVREEFEVWKQAEAAKRAAQESLS